LLANFVSAKVEFDENRFSVSNKNSLNTFKWYEIDSIKNYEASQILILFDSSGKTIYVVDHMTPGYKAFAEKVYEVVGI